MPIDNVMVFSCPNQQATINIFKKEWRSINNKTKKTNVSQFREIFPISKIDKILYLKNSILPPSWLSLIMLPTPPICINPKMMTMIIDRAVNTLWMASVHTTAFSPP